MKKLFILLTVATLVVVTIACTTTTTTPEKVGTKDTTAPETTTANEVSESETGTKPAESTTYKMGDIIKMGDLQLTVNSAEIVAPDKINEPLDTNNQFLFIDITIENIGQESTSISSMLMFKAVDKDGRSQSMTFHTEQKGTLDGELGAGRKMTGQIVFEVPKDTKPADYELIFEPDILRFGQAIIKLTK
ncbi:MAG: hypothetical protein PWQ93_205 [Clostridiales bacterium]|nr:hypothetical protein [Clostridiales bacterium]